MEHKPLAREDTMANVFVYFRKKIYSKVYAMRNDETSVLKKCSNNVGFFFFN